MSPHVLLVDAPQSLARTRAQLQSQIAALDLQLSSCSGQWQDVRLVLERGGDQPVLILLGPGLCSPLPLARRLADKLAGEWHFAFLVDDRAEALVEQLNSPVNGLGGRWRVFELGNGLDGLRGYIRSVRKGRQHRTTLSGINHRLAMSASTDVRLLHRYMVSVQFLENILDHAHDAIIATTRDGLIVRWNRAAEAMFDIASDQAVGRRISDISDGHWAEKLVRLMTELMANGLSYRSQTIECLRADGQRLFMDLTLSVIEGDPDGVIGFSAVIRDVTERRKTEDELARLRQELERLSYLDGLTGIANRRSFDLALDKAWARARRSREPLSLILVDLDHFKEYNDRYGHLQGDECLKMAATVLGQVARRETDLVCRYGGEEFALLLSDTGAPQAAALAQRCCQAVAEQAWPHRGEGASRIVTISAGVATLVPGQDDEAASLIAAADRQLYRAKEKGRNRIEPEP
ncbi:diguanylate cyclase [Gallaecimonas sp. GXIMD4217]|uniref:GGDEF domain-containing protein n=1 Tax=Gallaecimonas sp. GXIMD4217 TaxID=3131927 RepID=UPI00311ADEFF